MGALAGKKTYLVSLAMVLYAGLGYLLGKAPEVDWPLVLEGFGLAALRAGLAK